jgi:outer membrane protein OmpA-like peptidoglycan-associated protein
VSTQVEKCKYALELMKNPVPFNPVNLGSGINTSCDEYYPYISPDEKMMVFTRKVPLWEGASPASDNTQEDFYVSYFRDGKWTKAEPLKGKVNTKKNEGAQTLTADGKYMVFTACNRSDGKGACDLYYSEKIGDNWTQAKNLREINTEAWESQPSLSADGRELYFVSERESGYGNSDIYMSTRKADGSWSKPVVLDTTINTPMAETSPFIHPDGRTLYFCSNGHWGVGGFDIFMSKRDDEGNWSKPVNLGYPINTSKDEIGLVVAASGKQAYITSSRSGGYGLNDIYAFDLPVKAQAEEVTYVKGTITDSKNNNPMVASCEIVDLKLNKVVFSTVSDSSTGSFLMCLAKGREYGMFILKDGYMYHSENIRLDTTFTMADAFDKKINLIPIANGAKMVLPNIFYETDSFRLKSTSFAELDKIVSFLHVNSGVKIEISGHTDNTGTDIHNKTLSEKRAQSVLNYLISKGISSQRLTHAGYGSSQPVADNNTAEGKATNRRTELKIIP